MQIDIQDQGIGLLPDRLEQIFEPFARAPGAAERQIPGMGLGLHISRQIVEQHGGRIWATSAGEGLGSTFSVWLPCAPHKMAEPARILVVEDDAIIREVLMLALEDEGYDVRSAIQGHRALEELRAWPADLRHPGPDVAGHGRLDLPARATAPGAVP